MRGWIMTMAAGMCLVSGVLRAGEPVRLPGGRMIERVDFERHVAPLLSRLGCNAGSCHGAAEGQGGFRLSLFGYDAALDYASLTQADSDRVNVAEPDRSLLLAKPSLAEEHEGGLRLPSDSWEYQLLKAWIVEGARHAPGSGALQRLDMEPAELELTAADPAAPLHVVATYVDGERVDVTPLAQLRVHDDTIASVAPDGIVTRKAAGDTSLIATYSGRPASAAVLSPASPSEMDAVATALPDSTLVDRFISAKLRRLNIAPAPVCSDEDFLRRLTLTTIGQLPTPAQIRQFVADRAPDKRERQMKEMLRHPLHSAMWATRLCEITGSRDFGVSLTPPGEHHEDKWHAWFRRRLADNVPYDQMVRDLLCGTTRGSRTVEEFIAARMDSDEKQLPESEEITGYASGPSLDLFWQRLKVNEEIDVESLTERVSAVFLGVRMECARCHKHPFDRWTQNDYRSLANHFVQVRYGMSPELRAGMVDALDAQRALAAAGQPTRRVPPMREVYVAPIWHDLRDAATQQQLPTRALGAEAVTVEGDRRVAFAAWLTSPDNPYFARNVVNRVWAFYFGIGLVEPVDAFSAGNPPTHPKLLDALAEDFVQHGFDLRHLEAQILRSAAWQRAALEDSTASGANYARVLVRVPPAHVVLDAIHCAVGDEQPRAVELASRRSGERNVNTYFEVFNRPERRMTCDCERNHEPTLRQAMLLLADPELLNRIAQGHVARLTAAGLSDEDMIDELFLLSLSRWPNDEERSAAREHLAAAADRALAFRDILWSLINTREFVTIH